MFKTYTNTPRYQTASNILGIAFMSAVKNNGSILNGKRLY